MLPWLLKVKNNNKLLSPAVISLLALVEIFPGSLDFIY
jgi:hypothetical protein